jgi:beta-aspartyl-peptidase (threonine type)
MSLVDAGREALRDLLALDATAGQYMNIVAHHARRARLPAFTTVPGKQYLFQHGEAMAGAAAGGSLDGWIVG